MASLRKSPRKDGSYVWVVDFRHPITGKKIIRSTKTSDEKTAKLIAKGIEIEIAFSKKIGAGLFGGEGFILQRLVGDGLAFAHAGGTIIEKELAAGETLSVDTGCLVAFAPSVDYDIQMVKGFTNALFGGEGLFLAKMTGPGKVYLQSLPLSRLVDRIAVAANLTNVGETKGAAGLGGQILGDIISGL